jgi:hypothetical protein
MPDAARLLSGPRRVRASGAAGTGAAAAHQFIILMML